MHTMPFDVRFPRRLRASALRIGAALTAIALALPVASPARAGKHPDVSVFLHLVPMEGKPRRNCFAHGVSGPGDVVVHGEAGTADAPTQYLAYVLIGGVDPSVGITAVQFGIAYDPDEKSGVDVVGWNDCALYEWHLEDWPLAGTGNLLTWDQNHDCQTTDPVVAGFFQLDVYGPDRFRIIPRPVDGIISVASCGLTSTNHLDFVDKVKPENIGWVGFGSEEGYNAWAASDKAKAGGATPAGQD